MTVHNGWTLNAGSVFNNDSRLSSLDIFWLWLFEVSDGARLLRRGMSSCIPRKLIVGALHNVTSDQFPETRSELAWTKERTWLRF